jgi:hypothetical protein
MDRVNLARGVKNDVGELSLSDEEEMKAWVEDYTGT